MSEHPEIKMFAARNCLGTVIVIFPFSLSYSCLGHQILKLYYFLVIQDMISDASFKDVSTYMEIVYVFSFC